MGSTSQKPTLWFVLRSLLPVIWFAAIPYLPLGEWKGTYLWAGIAFVVLQTAWWTRQWQAFCDVATLLRFSATNKRSNIWSRFRGTVVTSSDDPMVTEAKPYGPMGSFPVKSGFLTLELKNGVKMPVRVGRAWSFKPVRNGDRVTVWGYYDHYFKAFWVDRSPSLSRENIRFRVVYWHGLFAAITVGHLALLGSGLAQLGLVPPRIYPYLAGSLTLLLVVWLCLYVTTWLIWMISNVKQAVRRKAREARRKKNQA